MRNRMRGIVLGALALVVWGCAGGQPAQSASGPAAAAAGSKVCVMQFGGQGVLRLSVPANIKCTHKNGFLDLTSRNHYVEVWLVPGASTVAQAVAQAGRVIQSEFQNLKTTTPSDLTVAGAPARHLAAVGNEADDGDPGQADLIVFQVGPHIFVGCTHSEDVTPGDRQWLRRVIETAQVP